MSNEISGEIKIIETDGVYDFDFDDDSGDFIQDEGLETAILLSLFLDKRATEDQVPNPTKRGGYWGYEIADMDFSHLWLVNGRKTQDKLNIGKEYCNTALRWLIDEELATDVQTTATFIDDGIELDIEITKPNGVVDTYTYNLWLNTDF